MDSIGVYKEKNLFWAIFPLQKEVFLIDFPYYEERIT